tara:strand:- start:400 stop:1191 length:792 start_codon:yes stop_codon:yes gene_type:complete
MTITDIELKKYHDNGYINPSWKFSSIQVQLLKKNIDQILLKNPNIRPEQIVCPHIKGGTKGELNNINHNYFLKLAHTKELINIIKLILGDDILLWGSQIFCKPAYDGMKVPMHQDAHYWPIQPMSTCSVWIAADRATKSNGCLTVIAGSHKRETLNHVVNNDKTALDSGIEDQYLKNKPKDYIILEPGQISLHHANLIHGSYQNNSPYRRAGIVYRYMSSHSNFNRKVKNHDQKDGHSVNYSKRPIWLINGSKKNNTLVKIHY